MGANASGKTTFGKAIIAIFNFINRGNPSLLKEAAVLKDGDAQADIDFVVVDHQKVTWMYRVCTRITAVRDQEPEIKSTVRCVRIEEKDRYETCAERLNHLQLNDDYTIDTPSVFGKIPKIGWYFSDVETKALISSKRKEDSSFIDVLNYVLKSFDTFIADVKQIDEDNLSYILIKFGSGESVIYHDSEPVSSKNMLSKGTGSAFNIAGIIYRVMNRVNGFYYCDEKFCFVQSELEKAVLSILIELLGDDQQLFFTTHNTDILDLDLPKHSYSFFRKNGFNDQMPIELVCASDYMKKQNSSLRNAVENDLFSAAPDDSDIYRILDLKQRD